MSIAAASSGSASVPSAPVASASSGSGTHSGSGAAPGAIAGAPFAGVLGERAGGRCGDAERQRQPRGEPGAARADDHETPFGPAYVSGW